VRIGATLFVLPAILLAGCGSHESDQSARLSVPIACIGKGCSEMNDNSGVLGQALLRKGLSRYHTRYSLLLDKGLVDGKDARVSVWESDELSPGTCSKPAVGRAYLNNEGDFPYPLSTMRRTSWSIVVFDGTTMIGCGSHTGDRDLQTSAEPLQNSGHISKYSRRVIVRVGPKDAYGDDTIILTPARDELGRPITHLSLRVAAVNGSSDIDAALRRGTCKVLRSSPDVQIPDLVPDEEQTWATAKATVDIPLSVFERQQWVIELGSYFGDYRATCAAVTPQHP
jgi:hypothetical protein